jgi:hypothetical protein
VKLEHGSTLRVYSVKHDPTSTLGTMVYPHSHLCKSLKYGQLGFQLAVSYQAGTVDSRADRNEKDNKSEALQGYRKENGLEDNRGSRMDSRSMKLHRQMQSVLFPRKTLNIQSPLRSVQLWRGYLHCLSSRDLVFIPCVRGGSRLTLTTLDLNHSLTQTPMFDLKWP